MTWVSAYESDTEEIREAIWALRDYEAETERIESERRVMTKGLAGIVDALRIANLDHPHVPRDLPRVIRTALDWLLSGAPGYTDHLGHYMGSAGIVSVYAAPRGTGSSAWLNFKLPEIWSASRGGGHLLQFTEAERSELQSLLARCAGIRRGDVDMWGGGDWLSANIPIAGIPTQRYERLPDVGRWPGDDGTE